MSTNNASHCQMQDVLRNDRPSSNQDVSAPVGPHLHQVEQHEFYGGSSSRAHGRETVGQDARLKPAEALSSFCRSRRRGSPAASGARRRSAVGSEIWSRSRRRALGKRDRWYIIACFAGLLFLSVFARSTVFLGHLGPAGRRHRCRSIIPAYRRMACSPGAGHSEGGQPRQELVRVGELPVMGPAVGCL
jgi:hypothetical protein